MSAVLDALAPSDGRCVAEGASRSWAAEVRRARRRAEIVTAAGLLSMLLAARVASQHAGPGRYVLVVAGVLAGVLLLGSSLALPTRRRPARACLYVTSQHLEGATVAAVGGVMSLHLDGRLVLWERPPTIADVAAESDEVPEVALALEDVRYGTARVRRRLARACVVVDGAITATARVEPRVLG